MDRTEKNNEIEALGGWLSKASLAVCADYRGLTVAKMTELRRGLVPLGASAAVVKNTLAKISIDRTYGEHSKSDATKFQGLFTGPSLLLVSFDEPIGLSKLIEEFGKGNEKFVVKGGWFENSYLDIKGVKSLASMPSKEETLAKLLRVMSAPATQLVRVMSEPAGSLVRLLEAQRKKLEGNS